MYRAARGPDDRERQIRLWMSITASPAVLRLFVTVAPTEARSPLVKKRGSAGSSVSGLAAEISCSADPNRDCASPATAMMRYVVSESGNVTVVRAVPSAAVRIDPSQTPWHGSRREHRAIQTDPHQEWPH